MSTPTHTWHIDPEYGRADGLLHSYTVRITRKGVVIIPERWDRKPSVKLSRKEAASWLRDTRRLGRATRYRKSNYRTDGLNLSNLTAPHDPRLCSQCSEDEYR